MNKKKIHEFKFINGRPQTVTKTTRCEDSKYEDIRKISRNHRTLLPENIEDNSSSDDDDSVVILDTNSTQPQHKEESEYVCSKAPPL